MHIEGLHCDSLLFNACFFYDCTWHKCMFLNPWLCFTKSLTDLFWWKKKTLPSILLIHFYLEVIMVKSKPVVTRQKLSMFRHNSRIASATPHEHWQGFFCQKMDTLMAMHSNSMFVLLFLVVLTEEVSRRLGGLYFNCDKVESLL